MKQSKKDAFPISRETWQQYGPPYCVEGSGDRKLADYTIGTTQLGDDPAVIITEPIFLDMVENIFTKKVTVHLNLYADPQLVVEAHGRLCVHNDGIVIIKQELDDILEDISYDYNRIRALAEIRANMYNASYLGDTTRILRDQLTNALPEGTLFDNKPLNYDFLKLYLREKYRLDDIPPENTIEEIVRDYSKNDLIYLYGCLLEYDKTGSSKMTPLKDLLDRGYSIDIIRNAYQAELSRRFFIGDIR